MRSRAPSSVLPVLLVLSIVAPVSGQRVGSGVSAQPPDSAGATAVPQTFDWWRAQGIPATAAWGQAIDTASTRQILSWTTMPEYTSPLVDHLPEGGSVVSPTQHFGYPIGRPGILHDVAEIYGYYRALAASTPRVRFQELGATEEGNHLALVQVGSGENLQRLDAIKAGLARLADPRRTTEADAEKLIGDLPVVYTFYAGLHSAETGPPEMAMELAYRLAASDDPAIQRIRDNVVVFIIPVVEADGRNRVVQWYRAHNTEAYDPDDEVPGPPYWGHYIMHDNNRDGLQMSLALTRLLVKLALEWHYTVGHDLHESVPYLYTSTGTGPYNNAIDPITIGEWQWLANDEVTALTAYGMPGVWTHGFYDGWYPGYLMWVTNNDLNTLGRFYETFGNGVPLTQKRKLEGNATEVEWYRPSPPRKETLWSLRNNTNYMETGALTALSLVAQNRERVLRDFWAKSRNSLQRGRTSAPYAWVVPQKQERPADAATMLNLIAAHGIEVERATADKDFAGVQVRKGDYVIRMDQPYRDYALTLMERQKFPEDAPRPYDDVGWTYPLMFNVAASAVDDSAVLSLPMEATGGAQVQIPSTIVASRNADWYAIEPHASAHSIRAYYALMGVPLVVAEHAFTAGRDSLPAGTWLVKGTQLERSRLDALAREMGMQVLGVRDRDVRDVARHAMDPPRIALLHTWRNTQDDGSVRVALERYGVPYTYIGVDELRDHPDLRARFDLVLMAQQGAGASGRSILEGIDPKWGPLPYVPTADYPALGRPDSARDITGGMSFEGLAALRDFVRGGGTFVALGSSGTLPVDMGMVRNVSINTPRNLFVPGSLVRGTIEQPENPLAYGYDATVPLFHRFGPYYRVGDDLKGNVVVKYAAVKDTLLLSGLAKEPGELAGAPAVIVTPVGKGTIVLFGFDPLHRFQNQGNFAFVWNAIMNWNDLDLGLKKPAEGGDVAEARASGR